MSLRERLSERERERERERESFIRNCLHNERERALLGTMAGGKAHPPKTKDSGRIIRVPGGRGFGPGLTQSRSLSWIQSSQYGITNCIRFDFGLIMETDLN